MQNGSRTVSPIRELRSSRDSHSPDPLEALNARPVRIGALLSDVLAAIDRQRRSHAERRASLGLGSLCEPDPPLRSSPR